MDFPVEATVHLSFFRDESKVRELLGSHGFVVTDVAPGCVRVKGSFLKLCAAEARLEELLDSQNQARAASAALVAHSSPPVSLGAVSKYHAGSSPASGVDRGRAASRYKPLQASKSMSLSTSPSSPGTSAPWSNTSNGHSTPSKYRACISPGADQSASFRRGQESFVVDADGFRYAQRLRRKDIETILDNHKADMGVCELGDNCTITIRGKGAREAAGKLKSLLEDLSKSLRTQEVPLTDMGREGRALLERISRNNIYNNSVLVCEVNDGLRLIGSSRQTFELKQKLLGGRTSEKYPRGRSSSLPRDNRQKTVRDRGAVASPLPVAAAGYSPSKYQDDKQDAWAGPGQSGALRRRTLSESRGRAREERPNGFVRETEKKRKPPGVKELLVVRMNDIKQKIKGLSKKK